MFVPVNCTACGKPFQVPDAALGKSTACPWCSAIVTALPVVATVEPTPPQPATSAPRPETPKPVVPGAKPYQPQPLSLDDAPTNPRSRSRTRPPAASSWMFHPIVIIAGVLISFFAMVLTVAILGYGSGRAQESRWTEFVAPDDSCSMLLPTSPTEEQVEANAPGSVTGGKRFTAKGWYTRSSAWLAWSDLDPGFAAAVVKDKDKVFTASAIQAELNREKTRLQGTVTKEAEIRFQNAWGIEVQMDTPRGKVIERFIVFAEGPRPRLYVSGVQAKNIAHDSVVVTRMFASFKVNE